MKSPRCLLSLLCLFTAIVSSRAAHPLMMCDAGNNRVCVVSAEGKIEWEHPAVHPQDCWRMPNGNYLFCFKDGALEISPTHQQVWAYKTPTNSEVHSCQPLPGGLVMLVECGPSRIIEVDRQGKITKKIKLTTSPKVGRHDQFRGTRKTKDGHYIVCFKGEHKVVELDGDGHKVIEIDAAEKLVWELNENDLPGNPLRLMAGCQRLPNGNTVFVNYLGHGHAGQQPSVIEVTRDKRVVWSLEDTKTFKVVSQVQLLDVPGDATKGEILR